MLRSLAEAMEWCRRQSRNDNVRSVLRQVGSTKIQPLVTVSGTKVVVMDAAAAEASVLKLVSWRAAELARIGWRWDGSVPTTGGRLLIFFPECTLSDGSAEDVSGGYFDGHGHPPVDTWVAFCGADLVAGTPYSVVAYVPPSRIEAAKVGIDVSPEMCIRWLGT
jgi:hypothetical protein